MKKNKIKFSLKSLPLPLIASLLLNSVAWGAQPQTMESESISKKLEIIPNLGYTYYNISGASGSVKAKSGNSIGASVAIPILSPNVRIEGGLEYFQANSSATISAGIFDLELASTQLDYLSIPLKASYIFNPSTTGTQFYVKGGFLPSYLMKAQLTNNLDNSKTDLTSEMNRFNLLGQAGIGFDWVTGVIPGRVNFDILYTHGFTQVSKSETGKIAGLQLIAGYSFNL